MYIYTYICVYIYIYVFVYLFSYFLYDIFAIWKGVISLLEANDQN